MYIYAVVNIPTDFALYFNEAVYLYKKTCNLDVSFFFMKVNVANIFRVASMASGALLFEASREFQVRPCRLLTLMHLNMFTVITTFFFSVLNFLFQYSHGNTSANHCFFCIQLLIFMIGPFPHMLSRLTKVSGNPVIVVFRHCCLFLLITSLWNLCLKLSANWNHHKLRLCSRDLVEVSRRQPAFF